MSVLTSDLGEQLNPSYLFPRSFKAKAHHAVSTSGSNIILSTGQTILDACGGAAVSCIGQGREEVVDAAMEQMRKAGYIHTLTYSTDISQELASSLLKGNPFGFSHAFFVSSGSEAMDTALKLARQYFFETGQPERVNFISRRQSYHGNTIGAMAVSYNVPRKVPYAPFQLPNIHFATPAYHRHYATSPTQSEEDFAASLADELESMIQSLGSGTVAAFVAETVTGATSGCVPPPKGYFELVRQVCDRHGVLLILDEVMCGTGRTGTFWAFEQENIVPDIVTLGKGLGGGYAPIAATVANEKVTRGIAGGSGSFVHGHTYQAHPLTCAAAMAVQKIIRQEDLVNRCAKMGELLERRLKDAFEGCTGVGDIRGRGLFRAVEFYDTTNGKPFPPELAVGRKVQEATFRRGVAVYPGLGSIDGYLGDHIIFAPSYTVSEQEIEQMVEAAKAGFEEVMEDVYKPECSSGQVKIRQPVKARENDGKESSRIQ